MAAYKDEKVIEALTGYLEPGETLKHYAFGVKQPHMALIILLMLLAILPGIIAVVLLTKNYLVGLTERRLIVLRVGGKATVKEVTEYALDGLAPAESRTGGLFTTIRIRDEARPFVAKFHRLGMTQNREQSTAIGEALMAAATA